MALTKVTRSGITDNSVNAAKIEDGTIVDADITPGTLTTAKLASTLDLSSKTVTLPNTSVTNGMLAGSIANAKLANSSITINGAAIALGGSVSAGSIAWQSVITSNTTMVAGRGYFVNTTSGAISMTLPSSGTAGDTIAIKDYAGTFATNKLTILRNSHKIQGVANDGLIGTNRASLVLVYIDATRGWLYTNESNVADLQGPTFITATGGTVSTVGDFKVHAFTGDSNFVVASVGNPGTPAQYRAKVDYLVVAGGGTAGSRGGGGAGGARAGSDCRPSPTSWINDGGLTVSAQTYPVTVGAGGSPTGSNSVFSTITSAGGGKGGNFGTPPGANGTNGGSGGGGGSQITANPGSVGTGNTPPVTPPQGNNGGAGSTDQATFTNGGGGGGWSTAGSGTGGSSTATKVGGAGHPVTAVFGCAPQPFYTANPADAGQGASATGYVSGGGGGYVESATPGSSVGMSNGGIGGGGQGAYCGSPDARPGKAGTANTGGGGGSSGGTGGKGIVLIRYKFQ